MKLVFACLVLFAGGAVVSWRQFSHVQTRVDAWLNPWDDPLGGGFQIVKSDPKSGYIYTQFEALKNGYIDDFEVAFIEGAHGGDRAVQVRSSSRVGYLDFGVNGKRVNFIAKNLRAKGWDAVGVDYDTHRNYAIQNEVV